MLSAREQDEDCSPAHEFIVTEQVQGASIQAKQLDPTLGQNEDTRRCHQVQAGKHTECEECCSSHPPNKACEWHQDFSAHPGRAMLEPTLRLARAVLSSTSATLVSVLQKTQEMKEEVLQTSTAATRKNPMAHPVCRPHWQGKQERCMDTVLSANA